MRWFHPVGGPVLVLPAAVAPRWRGQSRDHGFSAAYDRVVAALANLPFRGLDVGGLALAEVPDVGVDEIEGGLVIFLGRCGPLREQARALCHAISASSDPIRVPWAGVDGVVFDALEDGSALDMCLNTPLWFQAPPGPWSVRLAPVVGEGVVGDVLRIGSA